MKILAINGSHHQGNTYAVLNTIQNDFPDIDYELLNLHEANLEQCRGCYVCIAKGEQYCQLKDDRDMIIKKMSEADGIVFASPVYVNFITSRMKQFIERIGYMSHRPPTWTHDKFALLTTDNHGIIEEGGGILWTSEDGKIFDQYEKGFHQINDYKEINMSVVKVHYGPGSRSYAKFERPQILLIDGNPEYLYVPSGTNIFGGDCTVSYVLRFID